MDEWYSFTTTHDNGEGGNHHKVYVDGAFNKLLILAMLDQLEDFIVVIGIQVGQWLENLVV